MNMQHVVKAAGAIHEIKRNNGRAIEINFYGHKATYWPGKSVVVRNPVDGKFISFKSN